jgi:hypothetical protein
MVCWDILQKGLLVVSAKDKNNKPISDQVNAMTDESDNKNIRSRDASSRNMQQRVKTDELIKREAELYGYDELIKSEAELNEYKNVFMRREQELKEFQVKLKNEQVVAERNLQSQLMAREKVFKIREEEIFQRQKEMEEDFALRFKQANESRKNTQIALSQKEIELNKLIADANRDKERYQESSRSDIELKSKKFVDLALKLLREKENKFYLIATCWSFIGAASLVSGIVFAIYTTISGGDAYQQMGNVNLAYYVYTLLRGLIVVGLFGLLSRYAFVYSRSFMHESLKSGERFHAIKFGEFYLDAYGADANWDQIREAFENWNISGMSAFSKEDRGRV